jgi:hypothetical protein
MIRQIWFQNRQKIEKIVPRKRKKHKMLYLTWKVGFLYYFTVSNIFTDNLNLFKTGVFVFKQIAKSIPTVQWEKSCRHILLNPLCFLSCRFLNLYDTISFNMSCFHCSVWRSDHCIVFSKLVMWKVLLKLYSERYSFTFHFTKFLSHFLKKIMLNRN